MKDNDGSLNERTSFHILALFGQKQGQTLKKEIRKK